MVRYEYDKSFLLFLRLILLHFLKKEVGLKGKDIAIILNIEESTVTRMLKKKLEHEEVTPTFINVMNEKLKSRF